MEKVPKKCQGIDCYNEKLELQRTAISIALYNNGKKIRENPSYRLAEKKVICPKCGWEEDI